MVGRSAGPATKGFDAQIVIVNNRLPQIPAQLHAEAVKLVAQHGYAIEAAGKQKAPVKTGTLRRSIHTVLSGGGLTATVGPSVRYGIFVELGTRHMGARPYMRPAAELVFPQFIAAVKRLLAEVGA